MLRYFDKILLLFCIGSISLSWAQCPTNIQLGSQAEVNQFTTLFPGCSEPINLTITRSVTQIDPITNLNGLDHLTKITNTLAIDRTTDLELLTGLENITEIDGLVVTRNVSLLSLDGLQNAMVRSVYIVDNLALDNLNGLQGVTSPDDIRVSNNPILTSLNGLQNVVAIGFFQEGFNPMLANLNGLNNVVSIESLRSGGTALVNFQGLSSLTTLGRIFIYDSNTLTSVDGLENLTTIQGIPSGEIARNTVLTNLDGLQNLNTFSGTFSWFVTQNPMLSSCANTGVCALIENFPPIQRFRFTNNAAGCNTTTEVTDACALLPVTLSTFDGIAQQQGVLLNWTTAQETNNAGFSVQRLNAIQEWEELEFVSGLGNSSIKQDYQFFDQQPAAGSNFYRLQQLDYDGRSHYSPILLINWTTSASDLKINTYPNPAAVFFHMEFPGPGQLAIYSPTGERLLQRLTDGKSLVDCASWPRGMHLIKWTDGGREVVERIMIN